MAGYVLRLPTTADEPNQTSQGPNGPSEHERTNTPRLGALADLQRAFVEAHRALQPALDGIDVAEQTGSETKGVVSTFQSALATYDERWEALATEIGQHRKEIMWRGLKFALRLDGDTLHRELPTVWLSELPEFEKMKEDEREQWLRKLLMVKEQFPNASSRGETDEAKVPHGPISAMSTQ